METYSMPVIDPGSTMTFRFRTFIFAATALAFISGGDFATPSFAAEFTTCKTEPCNLPLTNVRYFVRYGGERAFAYLETEGQKTIQCTAPFMGDMAIGKKKECGYLQMSKSTEKWSDCAVQGQTCDAKISDNEVRRARLGYGDTWVYFYTEDKQFQCGLPYMGLGQERVCQISNTKFTASWSTCADEGKPCKLEGDGLKLVRYIEKTGAKRNLVQLVTGKEFPCALSTFRRDPAPYAHKMCQIAALAPVDSDTIADVLKKEYAAEVAVTREFVACVESNQIQKPVIYWPTIPGFKQVRVGNDKIPDLVGWRTCDLGDDAKSYILRYGNEPSSTYLYQEIEGQKSIYCDFKFVGNFSPGSPRDPRWSRTCWKYKNTSKPALTWTKCADQGKTCETGLSQADLKNGAYLRARYGKGSQWIYRYVSGEFTCSSKGLNVGMDFDPAPKTVKECQIAKATKATPKWVECAKEQGICRLPRDKTTYLVRYGSKDNSQANYSLVSGRDFRCAFDHISPGESWKFQVHQTTMSKSYSVTPGALIDPAPGKTKTCAYAVLDDGLKQN